MSKPLTLSLRYSDLYVFSALLQRGIGMRVRAGSSVQSFLCDELGISLETIRTRITTVFIDGKVVDKLESAIIQSGSMVALSAALPGLAGAALRRDGVYSVMRTAITRPADLVAESAEGFVFFRIKLFNLLMDELGPLLFGHGVVLEPHEARQIGEALGAEFAKNLHGATEVRVCIHEDRNDATQE